MIDQLCCALSAKSACQPARHSGWPGGRNGTPPANSRAHGEPFHVGCQAFLKHLK